MKKIGFLFIAAFLGMSVLSYGQKTNTVKTKTSTVVDTPTIKMDRFVEAAEKYVKKQTRHNDGYLKVKDTVTGKTLELKLVKIHHDHLYYLGNGKYSGCSDFIEKGSKTKYDIDFYFDQKGHRRKLVLGRAPMVHKINGKYRYIWHKMKNGLWSREAPKKAKAKGEHPAH